MAYGEGTVEGAGVGEILLRFWVESGWCDVWMKDVR